MTEDELLFLGAAIFLSGRINQGGNPDETEACEMAVELAGTLLQVVKKRGTKGESQ